MTEQQTGAPRDPGPGLETWIRQNRGAYTEDALRREAIAAGHPAAAVDAALAGTRKLQPVDRGRVMRNVFLAYLATYLILTVLILINPANSGGSGFLGDARGLGIVFLSISLGAAFLASLIWVASRRLFIGLLGGGIALTSLMALAGALGSAGSYDVGITAIVAPAVGVVLGIGLAVAAARSGRGDRPTSPSMALLVGLPLLLLLAIGGTCVASGLPIPSTGVMLHS